MTKTNLPLQIQYTAKSDHTVISLVGKIDEHADLTDLVPKDQTHVVLDLKGVERINSVGVSEWIRAMKSIPNDTQVSWENVSTAMVMQLNMISNFSGQCRIKSFYAPYYCQKCDSEHRYLLDVARDLNSTTLRAPTFDCPKCRVPLEFDDVEEDYLSTLMGALELT